MDKKLKEAFFQRKNVVAIAKDLLGKMLVTRIQGFIAAGMIVETEAYSQKERGCHAYRGRTPRNEIMFGPGGWSYVYLCYGIHNLFNIVTNVEGTADAVLVRALEPLRGEELMLQRMNTQSLKQITSGPGKLTKAMGIDRSFNAKHLRKDEVWIEEFQHIPRGRIVASTRIGVDYAGEDSLLPWRFTIQGNPWVSKP